MLCFGGQCVPLAIRGHAYTRLPGSSDIVMGRKHSIFVELTGRSVYTSDLLHVLRGESVPSGERARIPSGCRLPHL